MSRPVGRLNLIGAMNRKTPHSQVTPMSADTLSTQASVSRLERELKSVKEENDALKSQLDETRSALKQLTSEASYEKFDERRVNLLKLQLIQLQRQVLLLSEALGSRSTSLMEAENALTWLSETFRQYIGADVKGSVVPIPRSELITMVETSESARIKLFKNIENCSRETLARPHVFMNAFLKPAEERDFTVLDTCLGRTDCLNLKHVAQLESKLSTLYKELMKVSQSLEVKTAVGQDAFSSDMGSSSASQKPPPFHVTRSAGAQDILSGHLISAVRDRVHTVVLRAGAMARDCAADLLSLSLLYPSAPWPPLKRPTMTEVTYEALAPALPTLPRGKSTEVQRCVTAALKACNHRCHMISQEATALREEVRFHQMVYELQLNYVQQVFTAFRDGYCEFEKSTSEVIVQPMKKLLAAYDLMKSTTNEESLRKFLLVIKENSEQWQDIVEKLEVKASKDNSGSVALSAFGKDFTTSLNHLILSRQKERDLAAASKSELKVAQKQLEEELRTLIQDAEEQKKMVKELSANVDSDVQGSCMLSPHDRLSSVDMSPTDDKQLHGESGTGRERSDGTEAKVGAQNKSHRTSFLKKKASRNLSGVENGDVSNNAKLRHEKEEKAQNTLGVPRSSSEPQFVASSNSQNVTDAHKESQENSVPRPTSLSKFDLTSQKLPPTSIKSKTRPKPKNYEPRLYVANRTLTLRRSGSLSRLSEQTLEEKMRSRSVLSGHGGDNMLDSKQDQHSECVAKL